MMNCSGHWQALHWGHTPTPCWEEHLYRLVNFGEDTFWGGKGSPGQHTVSKEPPRQRKDMDF